jgi:microcompartment protein CcmK/EutM
MFPECSLNVHSAYLEAVAADRVGAAGEEAVLLKRAKLNALYVD